jgi:hypothetical protein
MPVLVGSPGLNCTEGSERGDVFLVIGVFEIPHNQQQQIQMTKHL